MQNLINFNSMAEMENIVQLVKAFKNFAQNLADYKYIDSISFFGDNGFTIRTDLQSNVITFDKSSKLNQLYQSQMYEKVKSSVKRWSGLEVLRIRISRF